MTEPTAQEKLRVPNTPEKNAYMRDYYEQNKETILARQREYQRQYSKTEIGRIKKNANNHRMIAKYPEKYKARYTLRNAIARGEIIKGCCEVCGSPNVESHHDDYSKPLEVRWFCRQHHRELEGRWIPRVSENN